MEGGTRTDENRQIFSTEWEHRWKKFVCRMILYGRREEQDQKEQKKNGGYDGQGCVDVEERTSRKEHIRQYIHVSCPKRWKSHEITGRNNCSFSSDSIAYCVAVNNRTMTLVGHT